MAAPGPSLTNEIATAVELTGWPVLAVQDAYKRLPRADILYGCDLRWWDAHGGCRGFEGELWSSHDTDSSNEKRATAAMYNLNLVKGAQAPGFSRDPGLIHYGENSGFQGLNIALLLGSPFIVLVGFDMGYVKGQSHFFGHHPASLHQRAEYGSFVKNFVAVPDVTIINATPGSALHQYPIMTLEEAIDKYDSLHCDWPQPYA